jgi:hypothetical protein
MRWVAWVGQLLGTAPAHRVLQYGSTCEGGTIAGGWRPGERGVLPREDPRGCVCVCVCVIERVRGNGGGTRFRMCDAGRWVA